MAPNAAREREDFLPEIFEPRRSRGQPDLATFDYGGLRRHAHDLITDGEHFIRVNVPVAKVLDEGGAAALILDQKRRAKACGEVPVVINLDHLALERRRFEPVADHVEQKIESAIDPPHGAN